MAMDADALQSTTNSAVNAQERAATQNIKMIARLYAETGVKRLMNPHIYHVSLSEKMWQVKQKLRSGTSVATVATSWHSSQPRCVARSWLPATARGR
jgi:hypothetical protein